MNCLEACINDLLINKTVENIIVKVARGDDVLCEIKRSASDRVLTEGTLFDMASVTKMVVTTTLALIAMYKGALSPSDKVEHFFFVPDDKSEMTVENLMTHTMGIGYKYLPDSGVDYESIEKYILSIPSDVSIGAEVQYSCPGFILLGRILEKYSERGLTRPFENTLVSPSV